MPISAALKAHLKSGVTTLCRCWSVTRADGLVLGFTDHDIDLSFGGISYVANSGMTAQALQQTTGLSVDNTEALGALSPGAVTEVDIQAGRYDGAEVLSWLVNWADVLQRALLFRGSLGEIRRGGGGFHAELRGLTEALNQPKGMVYQAPCAAVLGDARCRFDLSTPGYFTDRSVEAVEDNRVFTFANLAGFDFGWFERGKLSLLSGAAAGLSGLVKNDVQGETSRTIELWQTLRAEVLPGDTLRLEAGCDKGAETCRLKFNNFLNYRGFPDIPGEDWLMSYPSQGAVNDGGSLKR